MAMRTKWTTGGRSGDRVNLLIEDDGEFDEIERSFFWASGAFSGNVLADLMGRALGPYIHNKTVRRFRSEGDKTSGKWEPLKPFTVRTREEAGFRGAHPINRRTDELFNWATKDSWWAIANGQGATFQYPRVPPTGDLIEKVATAQFGKARPKTPARPVLLIDENDKRLLLQKFVDSWKQVVQRVG